jgi:imidazolonepropionase-like amidohydrolase
MGFLVRILVAVGVATIGTTPAPAQGRGPATVVTALVGGRLIDGTGGPAVDNAVVVLRGDRIAAAGPADRVKVPSDATVVRVDGKTVMPGLIEANGHVIFAGQINHALYWPLRLEQYYEIGARNLSTNLNQGVTTIRDTMDPLDDLLRLRAAVDGGMIAGSRLYFCGTILNYPGIYGIFGEAQKTNSPDVQSVPPERVKRVRDALELPVRDAAHGREIVRQYAARGVDFIKVSAHGGPHPAPPPVLSTEALREIVTEAHQHHLRVTTHTESVEGVRSVLAAGVDAMEHPEITGGTAADTLPDDVVQQIVRQKVYSVPLIVAIEVYSRYLEHPSRLDDPFYIRHAPADLVQEARQWLSFEREAGPDALRNWNTTYDLMRRNLKKLITAGALIAMGTDKGTRLNFHESANHVRELEIYVELGMTPMDAIVSATRHGAEILGKEADLGTVQAGKLADVIVLEGNPLDRISSLRNVTMVFKGGVRYK